MKNKITVFPDQNDVLKAAETNTIQAISAIFEGFISGEYENDPNFTIELLNQYIESGDIPKPIERRLRVIIEAMKAPEQNTGILKSFKFTVRNLIRKKGMKCGYKYGNGLSYDSK